MIVARALLVLSLAAAGCREVSVPGEGRLSSRHVLAGRPTVEGGPGIGRRDIEVGHFFSRNEDLLPLRDWLRANLKLRLNVDAQGVLEVTVPAGLVTAHAGGATTSRYREETTFRIPYPELVEEYRELCRYPWLSNRPDDACLYDFPELPFGDFAYHIFHLTLDHEAIDVRWRLGVLELVLPLRGELDHPPGYFGEPEGSFGSGTIELIVKLEPALDTLRDHASFLDYHGPDRSVSRVAFKVGFEEGAISGFLGPESAFRGFLSRVATKIAEPLAHWTAPPVDWSDTSLSSIDTSRELWRAWCERKYAGACPLTEREFGALSSSAGRGYSVRPLESVWRTPDGREQPIATVTHREDDEDRFAWTDGAVALMAQGGEISVAHVSGRVSSHLCFVCPECLLCNGCDTTIDPDIRAMCDGEDLDLHLDATFPALTTSPAFPGHAPIFDVAHALNDQLQALFDQPLQDHLRAHPDQLLRYSGFVACPFGDGCTTGRTGTLFLFDLDVDGDEVKLHEDNCPAIANDQADRDGDGAGDACDPCPTVPLPPGGDHNRDGVPDACDCDADGDGCTNQVRDWTGLEECKRNGEVWDQAPLHAGAGDDCDPDDDGDGVPDGDDSCPRVWNPGQEDSNGDGRGDACDGICPHVGAPRCDDLLLVDLSTVVFLRWAYHFTHMPYPPWCIADGPGCGLLGARIATKEGPMLAIFPPGAGGSEPLPLRAMDLDLPAAIGPDLDGDGQRELLTVENAEGKELVAVSLQDGKTLWRWRPPIEAPIAALAWDGDAAWLGLPDAARKDAAEGAALRVSFAGGRPRVEALAWGGVPGERFAASLTPLPGTGLVAAAGEGSEKSASRLVLLQADGKVQAAIAGVGARPSVIAVDESFSGKAGLLVGAPAVHGGDGAVGFFDLHGNPWWIVAGGPGEGLGASLVGGLTGTKEKGAEPLVLAGAPTAEDGAGLLYVLDGKGGVVARVKGGKGDALGRSLGRVPDLTGDGVPDLLVGSSGPFTEDSPGLVRVFEVP